MLNIFVSIINFNDQDNTLACLNSLEAMEIKDFSLSVVVVDNGSDTIHLDKSDYKNFNLIYKNNKKNLGFSGGQNQGIKIALENKADYVLILNNDTILDKELVTNLLAVFESEKECAIVSPKIYFAKGFEFHKDRYKSKDLGKVIWFAGGEIDWNNVIAFHRGVDEVDNGQFDKVLQTNFASGCCMLVKSNVFEQVGLFDEKYFLYYEDNDFSQRVIKSGFKIYFAPKAVLWHYNAGSAGGSGSTLQDYYITRNRLIFGMRYAPLRAKLALIRESFKLVLNGRPSQKKGVKDFYLRNYNKGSI